MDFDTEMLTHILFQHRFGIMFSDAKMKFIVGAQTPDADG